MRITVCIPTFHRPAGLARALDGVSRQELPADLAAGLAVLVVDNSAEGDARMVVDRGRRNGFPWPLAYLWEPRKGISHARNAALDNTGGADFLAFLDDDETPDRQWLWHLVKAQQSLAADVVAGPVLPAYAAPPPGWLAAGHFLDPRRPPDGSRLDTAYTGNVLFRRQLVIRQGLRFDPRLGTMGGEDIDFFDRLCRAGAEIRYCDRAIAHETIPAERMRLGWLIRRWFRTGNSDALVYLRRHAGPGGRLVVMGRGAMRLVAGSLAFAGLLPLSGFGRRHWAIARLYTAARGLGMLSSAFNIHYFEYAN